MIIATIKGKDWSVFFTTGGWISTDRPGLAEKMNDVDFGRSSGSMLPGDTEKMMAMAASVLKAEYTMEPTTGSGPPVVC